MSMERVVAWAKSMTRKPSANGYVPSVPDWFETRRAAQVVAFFAMRAGGRINVLKATKLVYLADRLSMDRREVPITNDVLVSMKFGPVNSFTYSYMCGRPTQRLEQWADFIGNRVEHDLPVAREFTESDFDELSRADLRILNETWSNFKDIDRFTLAQWTHDFCPEWEDPGNTSKQIPLEKVYSKLKKPDPRGLAHQVITERKLRALMLMK